MKVLLLTSHFNTGGITSYLTTLARGLVKAGHQVIIASAGGDSVVALESSGIRHSELKLRVKCEVHPFVFISAFRLIKILKEQRVDVIHAHTRSAQVCAGVASFFTGIPVVTTCHGFFRPHLGRRLLPVWGRVVIAISGQVRGHLVDDFKVPQGKVVLVPNGIDLERFHSSGEAEKEAARRKLNVSGAPVVGIIARLSDVKGHCYLIEAMTDVVKSFPQVCCLIVGQGPLDSILKAQVRLQGLEAHVLFSDIVNKTPEVLSAFDIFILPSVQEGLGLSAMEAGACGIPVIASRVGGIPEVVVDGETGVLVPPKDPKALAEAIVALLRDPARMAAFGRRAREIVIERFSAPQMVQGTVKVYENVLKKTV